MAAVTRFEDLEVWQLAREFAREIFNTYMNSDEFQKDFKPRDQINASSGSIRDNIAEGFERSGRNEFVNFLSHSKGSVGEVKSQLYCALDRQNITREQFDRLYQKAELIGKKTGSFIGYLNVSDHKGSKFKNRTR